MSRSATELPRALRGLRGARHDPARSTSQLACSELGQSTLLRTNTGAGAMRVAPAAPSRRTFLSSAACRPLVPSQTSQILRRQPVQPDIRWSAHAFSTSTNRSSSASEEAQKACIKCSKPAPVNALSCDACGALQPLPSELDAYALLGLDVDRIGRHGWDVDLGELKTQWRRRVALSHPDRMGGKDEKEQKIAEQQSALINKAYETLREPLQRAHLLLEKYASSVPSEAESLEDPEVLMEVMELREGLDDAGTEDDAAAVRQKNKEHLDDTITILQQAFEQDPPDVDTARTAAVGLRYWTNIDKAAREWQPGKRVELQH